MAVTAELADALAGVIRLVVDYEDIRPEEVKSFRAKQRLARVGVPFLHPLTGDMVLQHGTLISVRIAPNVVEYAWAPDPETARRVRKEMAQSGGILDYQGYMAR